VYFYPNMQNIPSPLALLIIFLNIKVFILLGPSRTTLHFKLPIISFFSRKMEQLGPAWTPLPKVLIILFRKICGEALFETFIPKLLLKFS